MPTSIKHLANKKTKIESLLAKWSDGLYYAAKVVKCDKVNNKVLLRFGDSTEHWIQTKDIHIQLDSEYLANEDDIVCCICDGQKSESPNIIVLCDVCLQGYHQQCHEPNIDSNYVSEDNDDEWSCETCNHILYQNKDRKTAKKKENRMIIHSTPRVPKVPETLIEAREILVEGPPEIIRGVDMVVEETDNLVADETFEQIVKKKPAPIDKNPVAPKKPAQKKDLPAKEKAELAPPEIIQPLKVIVEKENNMATDDFVEQMIEKNSAPAEDLVAQKNDVPKKDSVAKEKTGTKREPVARKGRKAK